MRIDKNMMETVLSQFQNPLNSPNKKTACGYCRFSSDMQREESIEAQQRAISEYAEKNGYQITEWYIDRAYSGKTANRPAFQRLLEDIKLKDCPYVAVLVHKLDRFSRNAAESLKYKGILRDYGIELISTVEKVENSANGNLLFGIMSTINQYYIDNLSTEVSKGMRENALKRRWNGGKPPLGYDVVNQELVINEQEAVIVRKIFEMAAEGFGYNKIIRELNSCGYRTKAGNPFGKNSLYDLIRNERYKGVFLFNRHAKRNSQNRRNGHKYKDESEIIRIEDGNPAIVSKELWERANASRKMAARYSSNAKTIYLLSGLLYCGECGSKMHGNHRKYGENGYNTYKCNKQGNQLACKCKEIRADELEKFAIDSLMEHFFHPEAIDAITEEINRQLQELRQTETEDVQHARNAIKGLELARNNLVDAVAQTGCNQAISDKLASIEKQIAEHRALIEKAESGRKDVKITREEVKQRIDGLREQMLNPKHAEQTKLLLQHYIERIVVDNTTVKATFKVAFGVSWGNLNYTATYRHVVCEYRRILETMRKPCVESLPKNHGTQRFLPSSTRTGT